MRTLIQEIQNHIAEDRIETGAFDGKESIASCILEIKKLLPSHVTEINAELTTKFSPEMITALKKEIEKDNFYVVEIEGLGWHLFSTNSEMSDWEYTQFCSDAFLHTDTILFFLDEIEG